MTAARRTFASASRDGTRLHALSARPDNPWGVVSLIHGHGEHCGRYGHVIDALTAAGLAVYAVDLRGHGRSAGRRGHVMAWQDYIDDAATTHAAAVSDGLGELPRFQLGHSMGGLVAAQTALARVAPLAGLILSGPLLGLSLPVPTLKALAGRVMSRLVPAFALPTGLDAALISHDPNEVAAYRADPLVHDRASSRWFTEMLAAIDDTHARAAELTMPTLVMHGGDDGLTDPDGSRRLAARLPDGELEIFAGFYHEIFNEVERQRPIQRMTDWLTLRRPA
jgi:lysophospholipase